MLYQLLNDNMQYSICGIYSWHFHSDITVAYAAPAAPTGLTATAVSTTQISLKWNAVRGATAYWIYRSTGTSTVYTKIASVSTISYKNTGLASATKYNYKIKAVQGSVQGSFSAVVSAYTKPATPSGLTTTPVSASQINLKWTAVARATSYEVYRSTGTSTTCHRLTEEEIWLRIRDRAIDRFTKAMVGFGGRCRKLSLTPDELRNRINAHKPLSPAEAMFLRLAHKLYSEYLDYLSATGKEDFDGLMQRAAKASQGKSPEPVVYAGG